MDGGIKFILAIALMVIPFYIQGLWSIFLFVAYLLLITFVLKVNFRTLLISGISFSIIVLLPYFFGLSLNALLYYFTQNEIFAFHGYWAIFNRILKLFVIWYLSILYFHTTPMTSFLGLLDKTTAPLKKIGLSIENYLKVIMCIVILLKAMGNELKENLGQKMRGVMGEKKGRFSINVKGIAQLIVNLILDSFRNLDTIEEYVDRVKPEDLYYYKFKFTVKDGIALLSFAFLIVGIWMLEIV
ncbi:MAG: energy-coupling factor transporter transmembrane protein EcfT [Desulfitobacterium sp.]|nr:energy-coupling factor transporter transmembrane protein EcfT [Desulfitobacterium sp.]